MASDGNRWTYFGLAETWLNSDSPDHAFSSALVKSELRFLAVTVFIALAVRLLVVAFVYPDFLAPGRDHWEFGFETGKIASSIVQGHGFANPYYGRPLGPTAQLTPVMPYLLAGIFSLFGIYTKAAALALLSLTSLFSALTCAPIFFIAKKCFGQRQALWAACIWAVFPNAINYSTSSARETALTTLLLSCVFWAALALQNSTRLRTWLGFGLLCGLTALNNPVVLVIVPFLGGWAWYQLRKQGRARLLSPVAATLVMCAVLAPWLFRNYRTFHRPVFLKDTLPLELCIGNVGNALHWWNSSLHPSGNPAELDEFARLGEQAYLDDKRVQAFAFIKNSPGIFLWRSVRRFVYIWTGFWSFNADYLREEPFDLANIPFCTVTTILALIGLRELFQRDLAKAWPCAILLILFPSVYYFTHPDMVYRHPLDPFLVILASSAVLSWRFRPQTSTIAEPVEAGPVPSFAD